MADLNAIASAVNGGLDVENLASSLRAALGEPGDVKASGRAAPPSGWLLCDGTAVSRTTYAALFAAIGTAYGAGNGSTTFNLPDLRGRVPVGVDGGIGRLTNVAGGGGPNARGNAGGSQFMPAHGHDPGTLGTSIESNTHDHNFDGFIGARHEGSGFAYNVWNGTPGEGFSTTGNEGAFHTHAIVGRAANEGAGGSGNMPPYQVVNYFIKT